MTDLTFVGCDGNRYDATLIGKRELNRVEIDVLMPGGKPFRLTTVGWRDHPTTETFVAWPRDAVSGSIFREGC